MHKRPIIKPMLGDCSVKKKSRELDLIENLSNLFVIKSNRIDLLMKFLMLEIPVMKYMLARQRSINTFTQGSVTD